VALTLKNVREIQSAARAEKRVKSAVEYIENYKYNELVYQSYLTHQQQAKEKIEQAKAAP
jgi:hypothetical protein